MREVLRTNDPVRLSAAESLLREYGIEPVILDEGTASLYGGGVPFIKRRIMVIDEDEHRALRALAELPAED